MADEKEIENLKITLSAFKGWWTRAVNSATPYATGTKSSSPKVLEGKIIDLTGAKCKVEDVIAKLQILAPFPEGSKGHADQESVLKSIQETHDSLVDQLSSRLSEANAQISLSQQPIANQTIAKAVSELKPDNLSFDAPPDSIETWMKSFEAYFSASNFRLCSHSVAQGYLKRCLDDSLIASLDTKIDENTPVLGGDSACLNILRKIFEDRFPIHSRRLTAFNLKQPSDVDFLEFYGSAAKTFASAEIRKMSPEDIEVFLLISATTDEKLKEEFFKLQNPNLSSLLACARVYQAMRANQGAVAVVAAIGCDARTNLLKMGYRCLKCSSKSHETNECRFSRFDLFCDRCRSHGHDSAVCTKQSPKA